MNKELIKSVVSSVLYSDTEFFRAISKLYGINKIDLDPCYSKGNFYKEMPEPKHKFDIEPQSEDIKKADCRDLGFVSGELKSIVFDPPFMFGTHGQTKNNIMNKRFSMFDSFAELESMYKDSLKEFYRILNIGGYLFFKCQDYTDSKTTMTHCLVWKWAIEQGFYPKDLFILVANRGRIFNPKLKQRHTRKFHSYWWVFQRLT